MNMNNVILTLDKYDEIMSELNNAYAEIEVLEEYHVQAESLVERLKELVMESNYLNYCVGENARIAFARYDEMLKAGITINELEKFVERKKDDREARY